MSGPGSKEGREGFGRKFARELANGGLGWLAGLAAARLVGEFFTERSWLNLWGAATRKTAVDAVTFEVLGVLAEVLVGFAVMVVANEYVMAPLLARWRARKADGTGK